MWPPINVEMNLSYGVAGKTEPIEKLNQWKIYTSHLVLLSVRTLVLAIMKNGCSYPKMHPRGNLPITDPPPPLKVWVSSFLSVNGNGKLMSAIMKNGGPLSLLNYTLQEQHQSLPKNDNISNFCSNFSMGVYEIFFYVGKYISKHS